MVENTELSMKSFTIIVDRSAAQNLHWHKGRQWGKKKEKAL